MTEHYGYAGKILIVNLTDRTSQTIDTEPYIEWVGGHGMASKLFWDYCEDKTVEAVDPGNVLVFAATPFSGAVVPAASARCEFTGISPFSLPEWYNRSSMGGRLAGMMKEAGYDACVVRGKAEAPVWISVVNDQVTFNDATDLWGLDTFECQERIWEEVTHGTAPGSWYELTKGRDGGRTTQRPSVICIGPAGENLARVSCIVHDAGHVTGQSGFGAVFGAKNLKAMSFIGSKSIPIADPAALVRLRLEVQEKFGYDIDAGKVPGAPGSPGAASTVLDTSPTVSRAEGCRGCFKNCRNLYPGGVGNELTCSAGLYFTDSGKIDEQLAAYSLLSKLGLNGYEIDMPVYLHNLYKMGVMGKGKDIDTDLPFEQYGTYAFIEELLMRIAYRREIGDDLAEGIARAAQKWGRWDEDTSSGLLARPNWGYCEHNEPRAEVEWSYGSIFSERDINEHGVHNAVYNTSIMAVLTGAEPPVSAENMAKQLADQSGLGDPLCFDWSEEGIYSDARARDPLEPRLRALLAAVAGHVRLGVAELHQPQAHRRDGLDVRGHARVRGEVLPGRHRARPLLRGKHRAGAQVLGARPRHLGAGGTPSRPGGVHELRVRREDHQALPPRGVRGREVELLAVPGPHARPRQVRGLQDALLRPRRVRGVHGSPDALRARGA